MKNRSRKNPLERGSLFALALVVSLTARGQAPDTVLLQGRALNADSVVDALATHSPAARTRSLRVGAIAAAANALPPPDGARQGSASLLITFPTNSSTLTTAARRQVDVLARALADDRLKDYTFDVEGHADARGSAQANLQLSQARAESVVNYLVAERGIAAERLRPIGKGDTEPLNRQDATAAENRRVTIVSKAP